MEKIDDGVAKTGRSEIPPDELEVSKKQAVYLSKLSGLKAKEFAGKTVAQAHGCHVPNCRITHGCQRGSTLEVLVFT